MYKFPNIKKNNSGSTAILMIIFILSAAFMMVLASSSLIKSGLTKGVIQTNSEQSYYAAEAGSEQILWATRNKSPIFDIGDCSTDDYIDLQNYTCSNANDNDTIKKLTNNAQTQIKYKKNPETITAIGTYNGVSRIIELTYE